MKLESTDAIVTAYAEHCSGPGWSNSPVWVIVRDLQGNLRQECIQMRDQTAEMRVLFDSSVAAHVGMCELVGKARK